MERLEHPLPDAAAWIRFFAERADKVPILRHTKRRLEELRPAAETLNAHVLSQVVLQDPLLTLRLMVTLQKRRPPDLRTRELTTIDRILLMLGIRAFYAECDRMALVEEELADLPDELTMLLRLIARLRRIFCAQAGGPSAAEGGDGSGDGAPPTVPMDELPPDAANPALAPSE